MVAFVPVVEQALGLRRIEDARDGGTVLVRALRVAPTQSKAQLRLPEVEPGVDFAGELLVHERVDDLEQEPHARFPGRQDVHFDPLVHVRHCVC